MITADDDGDDEGKKVGFAINVVGERVGNIGEGDDKRVGAND